MIFHMQLYSVSKRAPTTPKQMSFITEPGWRNLLCFVCTFIDLNVISFLVVSVRDSCNMPCLVGFKSQDLIAVMLKQKAIREKFDGELLSECFFCVQERSG